MGKDSPSFVSSSDPLQVNSQLNSSGMEANQVTPVYQILRDIPGNDICAECNAPEPEWASLNLGILLCIECSGVHRNLGVHISKVLCKKNSLGCQAPFKHFDSKSV